jgi:hypothetical protein
MVLKFERHGQALTQGSRENRNEYRSHRNHDSA